MQRYALGMGPAGLAAILFGWMTTEIGRQPWVVYGLMRTADAVSPHPAGSLLASLILFVVVYCAVFGAGTYYLLRLMREVPSHAGPTPPAPGGQRPIAAAAKPIDEPDGRAATPAE